MMCGSTVLLIFLARRSDRTADADRNAVWLEALAPLPLVDVFICKIRKKLEKHSIAITTVWGKGYTLENEDRVKINSIIDLYLAEQTKAVAA